MTLRKKIRKIRNENIYDMRALFLIATGKYAPDIIGSDGYTIGILIAVLVLVFLIYTLLKPEKF